MASIRLALSKDISTTIGIECLFTPLPGVDDDDIALARSVMVALGTDRRAADDDELPNITDDDRRGWWGDLNAADIWNGWPIGWRGWLLARAKLTDSAAKEGSILALTKLYIAECLDPFVAAKICSRYTIDLHQVANYGISGSIMIYRGPTAAIALEYQDFWKVYGGN